jgi:3-hydroxyacyl-CoA dehydrogenase/enoyl-CoA hydratase/3-hydroxybutyryl-CoA epimerase
VTTKTENGAVELSFAKERGIATLTLKMSGKVNKINNEFGEGFREAVAWALDHQELKGIIITSGHKDFCVGADIDLLYRERDPAVIYQRLKEFNSGLRKLETCKKPVVAVINGSALGGGCELALACHHRIALKDPRIRIGLPEVMLGVIPGGGGTQRLPRMIGYQAAADIILQGKQLRAPKAKGTLVDELADDLSSALEKARQWITAHPSAQQPWDRRGFVFPPPGPDSTDARDMLLAGCGMLYEKTAGAFEAPKLAIAAMQEGTRLRNMDRALEVEARYFTRLAVSDQAKDMISTLWYHRSAAEKRQGLPTLRSAGIDGAGIQKVGILGAGMMGAALGWVCARAGYTVVVKDIKQEQLDKAAKHAENLATKRGKHLSGEEKRQLTNRLKFSLELSDLKGCDLIIEAVFESLALKHRVTKETEGLLSEKGIWASNTSALPITDLAKASVHPERFIGLHFFSPVERMPLLELIQGSKTDQETIARCLDFCQRIKKTPILVNDGYAFYTTRVFSAYIMEGAQLVTEGHPPALIEWAARCAGMVIGPLRVFDEITLTLGYHALQQGRAHVKDRPLPAEGIALVTEMVEKHDRGGRAAGKGFFDYEGGKRRGFWSGLAQYAKGKPEGSDVEEIGRRLLLIQAAEAARAVEEGIVQRKRDAEVGAVFGIGFAPNSGGPLSFLDRMGPASAVEQLRDFAERFGPRYTPPKILVEMAQKNERFFGPTELGLV